MPSSALFDGPSSASSGDSGVSMESIVSGAGGGNPGPAASYNYETNGSVESNSSQGQNGYMDEGYVEDPIVRALRRYSASIASYTAAQFEQDYMKQDPDSSVSSDMGTSKPATAPMTNGMTPVVEAK